MQVSYAVTWEEPDGSQRSGRLELTDSALKLEGSNGGLPVERAYPFGGISGFQLARAGDGRLHGRPTLVVDLAGGDTLKIASVAQSGIVAELANRLSTGARERGDLG
jgi:ABC-type uncharacterized transport system ATPase subunit